MRSLSAARRGLQQHIGQTDSVHPIQTDVQAVQGYRCQADLSHVPLHAKLRLAQPNDQSEQEADRVADQVMQVPDSSLQPQTTEVAENGVSIRSKSLVQRYFADKESESDVTESVYDGVRSPSQSLDSATRAFMEPRFGTDFSRVSVHTNAQAAAASQSLNALAYTVGRNIVFGSGQYAPETHTGKHLLAHELTHVVQQGQGLQQLQTEERKTNSFAGLTARRTRFNNSGPLNAANCCAHCRGAPACGVGIASGAQNGMELEFTLRGRIPAGTEFDILRTLMEGDWERVGGRWRRLLHLPAGTWDDHNNDDECLIPNRRRIFVIDRPGLPVMNPRGVSLGSGVTVSRAATAFVTKMSFWEWVIARNRRLGINWQVISRPKFTPWHTITSLALVRGRWQRVNTPSGDRNEIERGRIKVAGATP